MPNYLGITSDWGRKREDTSSLIKLAIGCQRQNLIRSFTSANDYLSLLAWHLIGARGESISFWKIRVMVTRSTLNRQCPLVTRALRLQENEKSSGMKKKLWRMRKYNNRELCRGDKKPKNYRRFRLTRRSASPDIGVWHVFNSLFWKNQTNKQTKNKTKECINPDTTLDSRFSSRSNSKREFQLAMHKAPAVAMDRRSY